MLNTSGECSVADEEIRYLQNQLGIAQTAKNVYVSQLLEAMKAAKAEHQPAAEKKPAAKAKAAEPVMEAALAKKTRAKKAVG